MSRLLSKSFERVCVYTSVILDDFSYSREHIVPLRRLKTAEARAELHNVWPCNMGLNIQRSSHRFGDGDEMSIQHKHKVFVPPCTEARGLIARTCLYMQNQFNVDLRHVIDQEVLDAWLEQYPTPSPYENRHYAYVEFFGKKSAVEKDL